MALRTLGTTDAAIYVVCEPPSTNWNKDYPTSVGSLKLFLDEAKKNGFKSSDFYFIQLCDPVPVEIKKSKAKTWKHVEPNLEELKNHLSGVQKPIVTMGDLATRAVVGRACAITKVRGTLLEDKVYPILSPAMCKIVLENLPLFQADIATLAKLRDVDFDRDKLGNNNSLRRYWCTDIQHILDAKPKLAAVDTETTGLRATASSFRVLTIQIAISETECAVIPLDPTFWPGEFDPVQCEKLKRQVKQFCEDKTIRKVGQNINFERHALKTMDIDLNGILADTQILAWFVDENMITKTLDDLVRRFVPHLAGLNDQLNIEIDKENMQYADPEKVLVYSGNDGIMTYQLFLALWRIIQRNPNQQNLLLKLKMPGLFGFFRMESQGVLVDTEYLERIGVELELDLIERNKALLEKVPKAVIRKQLEAKKELKFSRADFIRDILFSKEGFNLKPIVFTASTKDGPKEDRLPSTSAKDHLPYFTDVDGVAGDFVNEFIEFAKLSKLSSTYVKGFADKYVHEDGAIHPKFNLHITVTGRSSSSGPNAQNFPSRGDWAKKYKKMLVARPGYKFISADLSQIELRLIAWESRDPVMLQVYKDDRDIHTITAQAVTGINGAAWDALTKKEKKDYRTRAKAVNFGFCYGMHWKKFKRFAKTDYKVDLTDDEAAHYYETYHRLYKNIRKWHHDRMYEANTYGYVTSLHGAVRHTPSVYSTDPFIKSQAERQAVNSPIQSFGSDLGVLGIARLARQCDPETIRPVMFIHDDIILEVKDGHETEALNALLYVLNNPPLQSIFGITSPIPIKAEPDIGYNLGEMHELYDLSEDAPPEYFELAKNINPVKPRWWDDAKDIC